MAPRRKGRWHERLNIRKQELLPIREVSDEEEDFRHSPFSRAAEEAADEVAEAMHATKMRNRRRCEPSGALVASCYVLLAVAALDFALGAAWRGQPGPAAPERIVRSIARAPAARVLPHAAIPPAPHHFPPTTHQPPPTPPHLPPAPHHLPPAPHHHLPLALLPCTPPCLAPTPPYLPPTPHHLPPTPPPPTPPPRPRTPNFPRTPPLLPSPLRPHTPPPPPPPRRPLKCGVFCPSRPYAWAKKCTWEGCDGCAPCVAPPAAPPDAPPPPPPPLSDEARLLAAITDAQRPSTLSAAMLPAEQAAREWRGFQAVEAACAAEWREQPGGAMGWWSAGPSARPDERLARPAGLRGCSAREGLQDWELQRVGPFRSDGRLPWQEVLVEDCLRLRPLLGAAAGRRRAAESGGGRAGRDAPAALLRPAARDARLPAVWVTAVAFALRSAGGAAPIRTRRSRLALDNRGSDGGWRTLLKDALQANGLGSTCAQGAAADSCALTFFPEGYGLLVDTPLVYSGVFNDIRKARSAEVTYWIDLAVRYVRRAPPPSRRLDLLRVEPPFPLEIKSFGAFRIPSSTPSLVWTEAVVPLSGRLHSVHLRTHLSRGFMEAWLLSASAAQLGLSGNSALEPVVCSPARVQCGESGHCESLAEAKGAILRSMRAANLTFRCIASRPRLYESSQGDVQPSWRCFEGAEALEEGASLTTIAFFDPRQSDIARSPWLQWEHQHLELQGWFERLDNVDASLTGLSAVSKSSYSEVAGADRCGGQNTSLQVCPLAGNKGTNQTWVSPNCAALDCVLAPARSPKLLDSCVAAGIFDVDWSD